MNVFSYRGKCVWGVWIHWGKLRFPKCLERESSCRETETSITACLCGWRIFIIAERKLSEQKTSSRKLESADIKVERVHNAHLVIALLIALRASVPYEDPPCCSSQSGAQQAGCKDELVLWLFRTALQRLRCLWHGRNAAVRCGDRRNPAEPRWWHNSTLTVWAWNRCVCLCVCVLWCSCRVGGICRLVRRRKWVTDSNNVFLLVLSFWGFVLNSTVVIIHTLIFIVGIVCRQTQNCLFASLQLQSDCPASPPRLLPPH